MNSYFYSLDFVFTFKIVRKKKPARSGMKGVFHKCMCQLISGFDLNCILFILSRK